MFVGGCAGSTTCGIKIFRLQILFIFIKNQIKKLIYPNRIVILNYNKEKIEESFINSVIIFIFSYLFLFLIISMLLSISGLDFLSAVSGSATAIRILLLYRSTRGIVLRYKLRTCISLTVSVLI